jgi:peptidoglycan/LPS O-acetylase OafA/YrhL
LRPWPAGTRIEEALLAITTANLFTYHHYLSFLNGSWWSIGLELWFSFLFPFLWWSSRKTGVLRLYFYVALLAFFVRLQGANFSYSYDSTLNPIKDSVLGRLDDFVLGFVLYEAYSKGKLMFPPAILFLLGAILFVMTVHGWDVRANNQLSDLQTAALYNLAQAAFFLMSLAALRSQGLLKAVLTLWPLRLCGAMCYSLYLWHGAVMAQLTVGWDHRPLDIIYLPVVTFLLAAYTYRYIEFGRIRDWRPLFLLPSR